MNRKLDSLKYGAAVLFLAEAILALVMEFGMKMRFATIMLICVIIDAVYVMFMVFTFQNDEEKKERSIRQYVDETTGDAVEFGDVGLVTFDENFVITWMSDLFSKRGINYIGEMVTAFIPELREVFQNDVDQVVVSYADRKYLVQRKSSGQVLFFKDITEKDKLEETIRSNAPVMGLINLDNYAETISYEDEQKITLINANVRQRVGDWCLERGIVARRIRNDRFIVFTDMEHFRIAEEDKFSILNEVRTQSAKLEVAITLSMAFAMGTDDLCELDAMVNDLLELAQNRGGDQAAIKAYGGEVRFVGGTVESSEKRSGVRIRVMAQSIRGMMEQSEKVYVLGHKMADFDCMGAMIGVSRIASYLGKEVHIVASGFPLEEKLTAAMERYKDVLEKAHSFIDEKKAIEDLTEKTLVVVVDHHTADQCASPDILIHAKKILVIDHHRRRKDDNIRASMVYLESSASSATELVTELLQYQPQKVELYPEEANIMFAGMVVDTNHFRSRCGSRSFEAAGVLREWGANPREVDDLLKNTFSEFALQNKMLAFSQIIYDKYILVPIMEKETYTRAQISSVADFLLSIQGVKASFVIAYIEEGTVAVSARSSGEVNVQVMMEKMNGGGHFSGAALQRTNTTVEQITGELVDVIHAYEEEEGNANEGNSVG
ncbi:MAG: DHH family phosphoesterase [Erysipelotrichales bacterium]|nr:DHH family phosphoesterase [Erysipelotrichales bacterium]